MTIILNGAPHDVSEMATVADVVPSADAEKTRGIAVALNGTVVRRAEWGSTRLASGDKIEVLRAVGGG